jgi:hypothetical protein
MERKVEEVDGELVVSIYCPICQKDIAADNVAEVEAGEHDGFIFVHDDLPHDDGDITALENGMQ